MSTQEVETHKSINVKFTEDEFKFLQSCKREGQSWKEYILSCAQGGRPKIDEKTSKYGPWYNPLRDQRVILNVEISNIRPHHAVALKHLFKHMRIAGALGTSRYYAFFADGDGDFYPKFKIESNVELPEIEYDIGPEVKLHVHKITPYGEVWAKVYGPGIAEEENDPTQRGILLHEGYFSTENNDGEPGRQTDRTKR